jgi:hypothetical protein
MPLLPRHLTTFRLHWASYPVHNVDKLFKAMPPTLTVLCASPNEDETTEFVWAKTSTKSSLLLPQHMKHLEIGYIDCDGCNLPEWVRGLPKSITSESASRASKKVFVPHRALYPT